MRLSKLSFLLHALLLAAVAAQDQKRDSSDLISDVTGNTDSSSVSSADAATSATPDATSSTSSSTSESESETPTPTSTSSSSTSTTTTTTTSEEPSSTSSSSSSSEPAKTSAEATSSSSSSEAAATTSADDKKTTSTSSTTSTTPTPVTETYTSYETLSHTTLANVVTSTGLSSSTDAASLGTDNKGSSSSSGLSSSDKKIIIGVVVGVGGAIILGAIGVVFWRIQKKRNEAFGDEDADLMGGTAVGAGPREKAPSPGGGTPFKNTLDQYHNPGPVNAASNF
ncbi:hypothetical protein N7478_009814 [Penicillium angulare]|uniref:uncharacterized protein n=1 Tax=Penicillium angulare TaxID=116970 RepID=UPI0025401503|nr:uncharacterized protein N7478_009814 [Penicillium angulare]KAJ5267006.1 hypothetical protein N7478_009814 [Penicillium angulare]